MPKYRVHKATGQAFIWWRKKRNYLGPADFPESIEAYNQFIAEIVRSKGLYRPEPETGLNSSALTVGDLMVAYLTKVQSEVSPHEFDNTRTLSANFRNCMNTPRPNASVPRPPSRFARR